MNFTNYSTTTVPGTANFLMDDMRRAWVKMEVLGKTFRKKQLQASAELVEMKCDVCGRNVTVTNAGHGDAVVVCRHIWEVLQRLPRAPGPLNPRSTFAGLRIELFDDGPARWGSKRRSGA